MNTFKFNFGCEEDTKKDNLSFNNDTDIQWFESTEIYPKSQIQELDKIAKQAKMFVSGNIAIGHVMLSESTSNINDDDLNNVVQLAQKEHSDLVAGKYEGGLKIWECTSDLMEYFNQNIDETHFENKQVLDLGCGAGILGIYAYMNQANVTFQDYNKEVIEHCTIPNVLLNIDEDIRQTSINQCKFYSGDWASFNDKCNDVFDIIVSSETIYNECNYEKLLNLFLNKLSENGVAYIAAKTYYFGVGGGTRQFEEIIQKNGQLIINVCWKSTVGIQREILKITRKLK